MSCLFCDFVSALAFYVRNSAILFHFYVYMLYKKRANGGLKKVPPVTTIGVCNHMRCRSGVWFMRRTR